MTAVKRIWSTVKIIHILRKLILSESWMNQFFFLWYLSKATTFSSNLLAFKTGNYYAILMKKRRYSRYTRQQHVSAAGDENLLTCKTRYVIKGAWLLDTRFFRPRDRGFLRLPIYVDFFQEISKLQIINVCTKGNENLFTSIGRKVQHAIRLAQPQRRVVDRG